MNTEKQILNIKEIAEYLQINPNTVYILARKRLLPLFKVGGSWRAKREQVDEWMEAKMGVRL